METKDSAAEVCRQLPVLDTSIWFLIVTITGVLLSFYSVLLQRRQLVEGACGTGSRPPDIFTVRFVANLLIIAALWFFYGLSCQTLRGQAQARAQQDTPQSRVAEGSARNNLFASFLVLLAGLVRFYDISFVRSHLPGAAAQAAEDVAVEDVV